jgi:TRAP-type uncharacterized transport system fused permease subunit
VLLHLLVLARTRRDGPLRPAHQEQICVGVVGIVVLLEAARRALGPALPSSRAVPRLQLVRQGWLIPELIEHSGRSFSGRIINTQWLSTEGVFGIPLGRLDRLRLPVRPVRRACSTRPAPATTSSSWPSPASATCAAARPRPPSSDRRMTGLISGSSIANVVTTGTFTIPLMKRVGFTAEQAGAVEVASSVNGQIMPPVMGAAAFLMVEFIGISYLDVIKHAFIPAVISYIALVYIVHLEALKNDMPALGEGKSFGRMMLSFAIGFAVAGAVFTAIVWLVGASCARGAGASPSAPSAVLLASTSDWCRSPRGGPTSNWTTRREEIRLPKVAEVYATGLHFILPIFVLVWFLMVERQSPAKSAFYAVSVMLLIIVTQRPLKALFRGQAAAMGAEFRGGFGDLVDGLIAGARNMIGIGVATAARASSWPR